MVHLKVSVGNAIWGQSRVIRFQIGSLPTLKNYSIFLQLHILARISNFSKFRKTQKVSVFDVFRAVALLHIFVISCNSGIQVNA